MFTFKKKSNSEIENTEAPDLKDRLFFHDLINHTHGLVLFLNQKEIQKEKIDLEEIRMISNEIKTLQSLIRDHYDFKHKNLVQTMDWVPFSQAKITFFNMCQTYLTDKKVEFNFKDNNSDNEKFIYYPSFYRILNNLIKNISEIKTPHVIFQFNILDDGIEMISSNIMPVSNETELPEHLARVILSETKNKAEGLGLESIHHMAEENGGTFSFEISNGFWINKLYLPTSKKYSDKKAA